MSPEFDSSTLPNVERILVLENPFSKNGHRGRRQLTDLVELSGLKAVNLTTDADPEMTSGRLSEALEPTDLLYVIGGDGTVNSTLDPLMRTGALLLPTRSGNANDLAMSINGRKAPWQIFNEFSQGTAAAVPVNPLEVTIGTDAKIQKKHAANYASVGYAALASHYVNMPWKHPLLRRGFETLPRRVKNVARMPREGFLLSKAAKDAEPFGHMVEGADWLAPVADISVTHSERMAKLGRFHIRHTDPYMLVSFLEKSGIIAMGTEFIKMTQSKMTVDKIETLDFRAVNFSDSQLYCQVDGEAFALPDESHISIKLSPDKIRVLSTRLY